MQRRCKVEGQEASMTHISKAHSSCQVWQPPKLAEIRYLGESAQDEPVLPFHVLRGSFHILLCEAMMKRSKSLSDWLPGTGDFVQAHMICIPPNMSSQGLLAKAQGAFGSLLCSWKQMLRFTAVNDILPVTVYPTPAQGYCHWAYHIYCWEAAGLLNIVARTGMKNAELNPSWYGMWCV